jgi:hypothetical protein
MLIFAACVVFARMVSPSGQIFLGGFQLVRNIFACESVEYRKI